MRATVLAAAAALALAPGAALAASGEDVFAEAVISCLSRHTKGAVPDVLTAGQVTPADETDPVLAKVHKDHGPSLKVSSDTGAIYITEEDVRCEVRGFDIDPMATALAAEARLKQEPYKAVAPLGKFIEVDGMIVGSLLAKTKAGTMMISIGRLKVHEPRTLFATVKRY